jgi:hypothetical protein
MVHNDLVHAPPVGDCAVIASNSRQQLVSLAADGFQSKRHRERHVALLQRSHVGNEVHAHDFRREGAVGRHDLNFAPRLGDDFCGLQSGVIASVVEYDDVRAWLCFSRDDLPRRDDEFVAAPQNFRMRHAAGRDDDDVRRFPDNDRRLRPGAKVKSDASRLTLLHPPVDDANHFFAPWASGCEPHLSAWLVGRLEDDDVMTAFRRDARGLQTAGARANNDNLLPAARHGDLVRHRGFAARRGVCMQ